MDLFERVKVENRSLGEMLVEARLISDEQLRHAMTLTQKNGCKIERTLAELGFLTSQQLAILIALQLNMPFINLKRQPIDPKALELIPESMAREYGVIPLGIIDGAVVVAMEDPASAQSIADLTSFTGRRIEPVVGTPQDIHKAIDRNYKAGASCDALYPPTLEPSLGLYPKSLIPFSSKF